MEEPTKKRLSHIELFHVKERRTKELIPFLLKEVEFQVSPESEWHKVKLTGVDLMDNLVQLNTRGQSTIWISPVWLNGESRIRLT